MTFFNWSTYSVNTWNTCILCEHMDTVHIQYGQNMDGSTKNRPKRSGMTRINPQPPQTRVHRCTMIKKPYWPAEILRFLKVGSDLKSWIFDRPVAKVGPETPLERLGVESCAGCTKNQPRRPHLASFREHVRLDDRVTGFLNLGFLKVGSRVYWRLRGWGSYPPRGCAYTIAVRSCRYMSSLCFMVPRIRLEPLLRDVSSGLAASLMTSRASQPAVFR